MKLDLPATPIDGYEIVYWTIEAPNIRIQENRLLYHVHKTWAAVHPSDPFPDGADFIDQWQIFADGRFVGRMEDWQLKTSERIREAYATRAEARDIARSLCTHRIVRLEQEIEALRSRFTHPGDLA